jgi:hypothetical protein
VPARGKVAICADRHQGGQEIVSAVEIGHCPDPCS